MIKVRTNMTGWKMWEHGVPNSRLTIIEQVEDYVSPSGEHRPRWLCQCSCGSKPFVANDKYIKNGTTKSCGCLTSKLKSESHKKYNKYDLTGEYGIGWTSNTNEEFYFDLEDYDKIKNYCWYTLIVGKERNQKTLRAYINKKNTTFHCYLGYKNYDHINRNELDNRKANLRVATKSQNSQNKNKLSNNTSGFIGVHLVKSTNKWCARINIDKKRVELGCFDKKEDAIIARLRAEAIYYKEFAPQKHLFEQYSIKVEDYSEE